MARPMSQIKGGYYAAAPEAVAAVLQRLRPPDEGECLILDPLCGQPHNGSSVAHSVMWPSSFLRRYFSVSLIFCTT
jgi:hypothetical protein